MDLNIVLCPFPSWHRLSAVTNMKSAITPAQSWSCYWSETRCLVSKKYQSRLSVLLFYQKSACSCVQTRPYKYALANWEKESFAIRRLLEKHLCVFTFFSVNMFPDFKDSSSRDPFFLSTEIAFVQCESTRFDARSTKQIFGKSADHMTTKKRSTVQRESYSTYALLLQRYHSHLRIIGAENY